MRNKNALPFRLVGVLVTLALLNSGCSLLDTIIRAIGRACDTPEILVSRTDDTPSGLCASGNCSLRQAVTTSNDCPGIQTIRIPAGTYVLNLTGAYEDLNRTGDLDIIDGLNVIGEGTPVIDGNHSDRIFDIKVEATVDMTGLLVQNGLLLDNGGGILNHGTLHIHNSTISHNSTGEGAWGDGGGICSAGPLLTIDHSEINWNSSSIGGGIMVAPDYCEETTSPPSSTDTPTVTPMVTSTQTVTPTRTLTPTPGFTPISTPTIALGPTLTQTPTDIPVPTLDDTSLPS